MRLTEEEIKMIKQIDIKFVMRVMEGEKILNIEKLLNTWYGMLDTIEALQQENDESKLLPQKISHQMLDRIEALQQEIEQLRAQVAYLRNDIEAIIKVAEEVGANDIAEELQKHLLSIEDVTNYNNPADAETMKKAREALEWCIRVIGNALDKDIQLNYLTLDAYKEAHKALAEIDKAIGGKAHE